MPHHPTLKKIIRRPVPQENGLFQNLSPLLQRIYLSRELTSSDELDRTLAKLPSPWLLSGMDELVNHLISLK